MSDEKDEITKIEDLPNIDRSQEEEDFTNLTDIAYKMGLEDKVQAEEDDTPPPLDNLNADSLESPNNFESDENLESDNTFYDSSSDDGFSNNNDDSSNFYSYSENDYDESEYKSDFEEDDHQDSTNNDFQSFEDTNFSEEIDSQEDLDFSNEEHDLSIDELNDLEEDSKSLEPNPESENQLPNDNNHSFLTELSEIAEKVGIGSNLPENDDEITDFEKEKAEISPVIVEEKPVLEKKVTKTEIKKEEAASWSPPKSLNEITDFANNTTYGSFQGEATPPFSIILKNFKYKEDLIEITNTLIELNIFSEEERDNITTAMERGQLLIPRLSEYAAIIICHKMRAFDLEILMGLTEEIHPPKSYTSQDRGFTSKYTVKANKDFHKEFTSDTRIITTSLPNLAEYKIVEHIGLISHTLTLDMEDLTENQNLEDSLLNETDIEQLQELNKLRIERENSIAAQSEYLKLEKIIGRDLKPRNSLKVEDYYQKAVEELKIKAVQQKANSILGINFQVIPINISQYNKTGPKFQIMATGNLAWIEKI